MHQFAFQGAAEAFHRRAIPAVSFATHGRLHAKLPKQFLVSMSTVLAAAIRVVKQAFFRALGGDGPKQRLHDQWRSHAIRHGVADQFATEPRFSISFAF